MKEKRLGPRQWAFVVVAGGAVLALPFTTRKPIDQPASPVVDADADLLPSASFLPTPAPTADNATGTASTDALPLPKWPGLRHSPFDELVQEKVSVPEAAPTEVIVPMQPLRPWITAPNMTHEQKASVISNAPVVANAPNSVAQNATNSAANDGTNSTFHRPSSAQTVANKSNTKPLDSLASSSPWREDEEIAPPSATNQPTSSQVVSSYGQGRRNLPVTAGPADQYTAEEIASKLNLPKQELASAIVPPDPPDPRSTMPKSSVVLSRQPISRPTGVQVRFGQAHSNSNTSINSNGTSIDMTPLPKLPEERRHHVIHQPTSR